MRVRPRVYIEVCSTPPMAAGLAITQMLQKIGAEPFLAPPSHGDLQVSWEELMEFDPQLVVYAVRGQGCAAEPEQFYKVEGWDRTEAAVNRRVFSMDDALLTPERLPEGTEFLQALIAEQFFDGPTLSSSSLRRLF